MNRMQNFAEIKFGKAKSIEITLTPFVMCDIHVYLALRNITSKHGFEIEAVRDKFLLSVAALFCCILAGKQFSPNLGYFRVYNQA